MHKQRLSIAFPLLLLAGCSLDMGSLGLGSSYHSHGAAVEGYGPIKFGMSKDDALKAVAAKGGVFEAVPGKTVQALKYTDAIDYLPVRVTQSFSEEKKTATKAEVYLSDPEKTSTTLDGCKGYYGKLYTLLEARYGKPDWPARSEARGAGEAGVVVYTFADSSSITLIYEYAVQEANKCTVKLTFAPPWA